MCGRQIVSLSTIQEIRPGAPGASDPERCAACAVRHRAVCGALTATELKRLNAIARRTHVPAGAIIFHAQEEASYLSNIVSGVIKLSKSLADGRQQIVGLQFAPDFLGRAFGGENPYFAEAVTDVELCQFSKAKFEELLVEYPMLEQTLFERTLDELDSARDWMLLLGRKTAVEKVATFLLLLARRAGDQGCLPDEAGAAIRIVLPITRADIADYLGLTIETVSRQITRFKSKEIIQMVNNRTIIIPDLGALEEIADKTGDVRY